LDKVGRFFRPLNKWRQNRARALGCFWAQGRFPASGGQGEAVAPWKPAGNLEALRDDVEVGRTLRVLATAESSRGNDERAIALLKEC